MYQLSTLTFTHKEHLTLPLKSAIAVVLQFHHGYSYASGGMSMHHQSYLLFPLVACLSPATFPSGEKNCCIAFAVFIRGLSSVPVVLYNDMFRFPVATLGFQRDYKEVLLPSMRINQSRWRGILWMWACGLLMVSLTWSKVVFFFLR